MNENIATAEVDLADSKILIVEDSAFTIDILRKALEPQGYRVSVAPSGEVALKIAPRTQPDLILLDVMMGGMDGLETCRKLKQSDATKVIPIIFLTAKSETESSVEGFRVGAVDYIRKPFQIDDVLVRVETHLRISRLTKLLRESGVRLAAANAELQQELARREQADRARQKAEAALRASDEQLTAISRQEAERWGIAGFVAQSAAMSDIMTHLRRLQDNDTAAVLITGETGTGKEMIARAIHYGGLRAKGPFLVLNCSAIPTELAESTLFGHMRGAFTGAHADKKGYFELANNGTLFLDEIGDMSLGLQAKLLRVLEYGVFTPVGSVKEVVTNVRILSATHVDLRTKIEADAFREDLYYRLAGFELTIPPLRERRDDVPLLVAHFLNQLANEMRIGKEKADKQRRPKGLSDTDQKPELITPEALEVLMNYHFPGNIRELKNILERALIESHELPIRLKHLHMDTRTANRQDESSHVHEILSGQRSYAEAIEDVQREILRQVLNACNGKRHEAARRLQMHRPNLIRLLKRLKIDREAAMSGEL